MAKYLYNGVELPALPEWDKNTYPYVMLYNFFNNVWFTAFDKCPATNGTAEQQGTIVNPYNESIYILNSRLNPDGESWVDPYEGSLSTEGQISLPFWANFDVYYSDGGLYLAASDPLPVGGEPEPEQTPIPLYYSKGGVWRRLFRKVNGAWEEVDGVFGLTPEVRELKELHDSLGVVEPFIYFTDPHLCEGVGWQPRFHECMAKVKQAYDNSPCKLVICGGDWIGNSDTKEEATTKLSYVADYMRRLFGNNHLLILGNHDTNYQGTEQLTQQELIDLWFKDTNTGKAYYYHDTQTTRFLVLDTQTDWNPEWSEYFQEQRDWLAANLSAELKNVVVAHIDWVDSELTTRTSLVDVIQYVDGVDMILAGHIHADHVNYGVVPEVVTTNLQAGGVPTFDLCLLDVENNQLHMVRVGTGENRTINLGGAS